MDERELSGGDLDADIGVRHGEAAEGLAEFLGFLDGFDFGAGDVAAEVGSWVEGAYCQLCLGGLFVVFDHYPS